MESRGKYEIGFFFWNAVCRYKYYLFMLIYYRGTPNLQVTEAEASEAEKQFQSAKRDFAKAVKKLNKYSVEVPIQLIESVRLTEATHIDDLSQFIKYIESVDRYLETIKFF